MALILASRLERIARELEARSARGISPSETEVLATEFALMAELARRQEGELAVHRLGETERTRRAAMEQEAGTALGDLIADPEGIVIRPDFRRGS
ncbi:hypothetical protein [Nitratireductor soli]|uniref:hypothetical protein n=1 Tax=Nitratireductor soli TaxID=1670619 RepID=UPI00065E1BA6|nr:hypothetical protein [Nitratireductor soli]